MICRLGSCIWPKGSYICRKSWRWFGASNCFSNRLQVAQRSSSKAGEEHGRDMSDYKVMVAAPAYFGDRARVLKSKVVPRNGWKSRS